MGFASSHLSGHGRARSHGRARVRALDGGAFRVRSEVMRRVLLGRVLPAALAVALPALASAQDGTPVQVTVGKKVVLCKEGLAVCPSSVSLCDDPKIAFIENGPDGPELRGVSPGTTLCSSSGPGGAHRRVLRVTVVLPRAADGEGKTGG